LASKTGSGEKPALHLQSSSESLPGSELALRGHAMAKIPPSRGWYVLAGAAGHNPEKSVIFPIPQGQLNLLAYVMGKSLHLSKLDGTTGTKIAGTPIVHRTQKKFIWLL
jgi:hypothetical protein